VVIVGESGLLQGLLQRLADGTPHTTAAMGRDLGVSAETLDRMIGDLARLGYLQIVEATCPDRCGGCPLAGSCAVGRPPRMWLVTERGKRVTTGAAG